MWNGLAVLLFLCASLAVSSYLAGVLPLSFTLSRKHMRLLTACGTGILVGTSLIVIIPEGVETLYGAKAVGSGHSHSRLHVRTARTNLLQPRSWDSAEAWESEGQPVGSVLIRRTEAREPPLVVRDSISSNGDREEDDEPAQSPGQQHGDDDDDEVHDFEPHAWIGVSIIAGFVLMYLIDKLPKIASAQSHLRPAYVSLQRMGIRGGSSADDDGEIMSHPAEDGGIGSSSTTMGLVIHAAADGVALGASSTASTQKLSLIIFFALMIHKAPAAFGLTAVLLKQGLSKRAAKAHLVVFSLAAPVGAVVTWFAAQVLAGGSLGHESKTGFVTGLLLLFSGGTFLYVAMHTMQDGGHDHSSGNEGEANGYADIYQQQAAKQTEGTTLIDTLATVGGMLLPLVLTLFGHGH